jgi:hypothetical protein
VLDGNHAIFDGASPTLTLALSDQQNFSDNIADITLINYTFNNTVEQ